MSVGSPDRIDTLTTRFRAGGHVLDPVRFATAMLARAKAEVARDIAEGQIMAAPYAALLDVTLGDPDATAPGRPVHAYVNAGRWVARCECGGAEYVDLAMPIFMCCSCWNRATGNAWRRIIVPAAPARASAERVLLARPDPATRNWRPADGETITFLRSENASRGYPEVA